MRTGRFETFRAADGWRWRLVAANGEVVCQSEAYTKQDDALRGAKDAKKAARRAEIETS